MNVRVPFFFFLRVLPLAYLSHKLLPARNIDRNSFPISEPSGL